MTTNQTMLLKDAETEPTNEALQKVMNENLFSVYNELLRIASDNLRLTREWRYYKDGKAWLCKVVHKKKTIFWLSLWDGFIKTSFHFTEKTRHGIADLNISKDIKDTFDKATPAGKLIPLILDITRPEQLNDFQEIAAYKKSLK